MKKLLFVMNPAAGTKKANRVLPQIISIFNAAGYEVICYMTEGPGSAAKIVAGRAAEAELVVCCGGDGTFNETVSGLLEAGLTTPIGYIPAGSTNDFAASLGLPTDILTAAKHIVQGAPQSFDVGIFGSRHFSYVASFGAFTKASYATPQNLKNALGHVAYVLSGISELGQIKPFHLRLAGDGGQTVEDDFIFGAVSNSTSMGGVLTLDPSVVDMRDGKFEVLLIRAPKNLGEIADCLVALQSYTYNCAMISFFSASCIRITAPADMPWTLDGEKEEGHESVEVKNLHNAIRLVVKQ